MKKILITGGAGFVGYHLAKELAKKKYQVHIFDVHKNNVIKVKNFIKGDISNLAHVLKACKGMDGIIHLAAVSRVSAAHEAPNKCIDINVKGTANVLEAARLSNKKPWVITSSSQEVQYDWNKHQGNNNLKNIKNLYGISKFMAEFLCHQYFQEYDLRVMVLRFTYVYGSKHDNPDKVVPKLISRALKGETIVVHQSAPQFDFIHFKDILKGICLAIQYAEKRKKPFFQQADLKTGSLTHLKKIAQIIVKETQSSSKISYVKSVSPGRVPRSKTVKNILGFKAKYSIKQGITETVKEFI